jgi:hypothetical protein
VKVATNQREKRRSRDLSCRLEPQEGKKLAGQVRGAPVLGGYMNVACGLAKTAYGERERKERIAWKGKRKERKKGMEKGRDGVVASVTKASLVTGG